MDDSNTPPMEARVIRPAPPPLRIHHLLIWTTLTAAIIAGCMSFDRAARNGPAIKSKAIIAGLVLGAVVIAGVLTVVGSGVYWRSRGVAFPQSPGDWLLVIIAAAVAGFCIAFAAFLAIFFTIGDDDWFTGYYFFVGVVETAAWIVAHIIGIKRYSDTYAWRVTFVVLMFSPFAIGPTQFVGRIVVAVIACVLWAACVDWHKHIPRQWTHWCGVACAISLGISLICVFGF